MNDNDIPRDRNERMVAASLVHAAVSIEHLTTGLNDLLTAYGAPEKVRSAVADFMREQVERTEEFEAAAVHNFRLSQGDAKLNDAVGEMMGHVLTRLDLLSEEVERTTGPRHLMAVAGLREFSKTASEAWFGPREPPKAQTVKAPVIEWDLDR